MNTTKQDLTFILDYYSSFEFDLFNQAIFKSCERMIAKLKRDEKKENKAQKEFDNYVKANNLDDEEIGMLFESGGFDLIDLMVENHNTRERLTSISEMKIIYLYKSLEIAIRNMLNSAIPNIDYKWDNNAN